MVYVKNSNNTTKLKNKLIAYAAAHNGKLLSSDYVNSETCYSWECKEGHKWSVKWHTMRSDKTWCKICAGKGTYIISALKQYAVSKRGKLLSTEYINNSETLLWQCKYGHIWKACWRNINRLKQWCPTCAGYKKATISELKDHARDKGGKLLSTSYISCFRHVLWECSKGHQWLASWLKVKNSGTWCPECSSFKTEKLVKQLLENKLDIVFTKTRFIYNNKRYEFDGYNEEHKIAFEYHGIQHYKYPNYWHKTEEIFKTAQQRDRDKAQYCIDNGIKLIVIPYTENKDLNTYINKLLNLQ